MKESHGEGVATHTGPESCAVAREGGGEALTGGWAGRVFSRESPSLRGADAGGGSGRPHPARRPRETRRSPARSETPGMPGQPRMGRGRSRARPWGMATRAASGSPRTHADDERAREVGPVRRTGEALEQGWLASRGGGGGKGPGQGELAPAPRAPDSGPGRRAQGAGAGTSGSAARSDGDGSRRSCTTSTAWTPCGRRTSRSSARPPPGWTASRGGTTGRRWRRTSRGSPRGCGEGRTGRSLPGGRTSRRPTGGCGRSTRRWPSSGFRWAVSGIARSSAGVRRRGSSGPGWPGSSRPGCLLPGSAILIPCAAWA